MERVSPPGASSPGHLVTLSDGTPSWLRPLRPEDDAYFGPFDRRVTDEDRRLRFFAALTAMSERQIEALTHYNRTDADAVIALTEDAADMMGVARLHRVAGGEGEFAVLVRSDLKGRGLARHLLDYLFARASRIGVSAVDGFVLRDNQPMLSFARDFGFALSAMPNEPDVVRARLTLPVAALEMRAGAQNDAR